LSPPGAAMPPDREECRPGKSGIHDAAGSDVSPILGVQRCWSWQIRHRCDCRKPGDCLLNEPLPVHQDQPCRGMFGDGGKWQPCCRGAA
jgi:hypothetical protein